MDDPLPEPLYIMLVLFLIYAIGHCLMKFKVWIMQPNNSNRIRRRSTVISVLVIGVEPAQDREQLVPTKNVTPDLQASSAADSDLVQQEKQTELSEKCDNFMHLLEGTGENKNVSI